MSKNEWSQERTDRLVSGILEFSKSGLWVIVNKDSQKWIHRLEFTPATDLNHAMMLVESEWFRSKYYICITNANGKWWVTVHINCGVVVSESIDESLPLAICLTLEKLEV